MSTIKKLVLSALALAVVAAGVFLVWFFVIKEEPKARLTTSDRDKALSTEVVGSTPVDGSTAGTSIKPADTSSTSTSAPAGTTPGAKAGGSADGTWSIEQAKSTVGYRVKEVLAGLDTEGVGRTDQVTGSLTINGSTVTAASFSVDVASITSDESRRDGQFRGRIMNVAEFPTATFELTSPIEFAAVPADGQSLQASATGDLTLHGVTKPVTFEVDAKLQGGKIGVVGSIKVVFADYSIPNPSNPFAKTGEDGLLEFVLVFVPA